MRPAPIRWLLILCLLLGAPRAWALGEICLSCQQPIKTTIYLMTSPYYQGSQMFCAPCSVLKTKCAVCRLPFLRNVDLKDGRYLCPKDAKTAVLSGEEAQSIFHEVTRDMIRLLAAGKTYPDRNIIFNLADQDELQEAYRRRRFPQTHNTLLGLTRPTRTDDNELEFKIDVISGLPRGQFIGVCAHEYGHAWLEANARENRLLDADAEEGFCELLAWKILSDRGEHLERDLLRLNKYTQGQIDVFIQAEADYGFYRVMKWVLGGEDSKLTLTNTVRLLALAQDTSVDAAAFAWPPPQAALPPAPETLVLKAISGAPKRRFALINGATLGLNETAKVRVSASNVVVRCLEINEHSVLLEVAGTTNRTELFLPKSSSLR